MLPEASYLCACSVQQQEFPGSRSQAGCGLLDVMVGGSGGERHASPFTTQPQLVVSRRIGCERINSSAPSARNGSLLHSSCGGYSTGPRTNKRKQDALDPRPHHTRQAALTACLKANRGADKPRRRWNRIPQRRIRPHPFTSLPSPLALFRSLIRTVHESPICLTTSQLDISCIIPSSATATTPALTPPPRASPLVLRDTAMCVRQHASLSIGVDWASAC
jgi:hypothetical protein